MKVKIDPSTVRIEIEKELCARSLKHYCRKVWEQVNPEPFQDNWHIGAVCEHLQAVSDGQIEKLIINIPPRHGKSNLCSVMWPTWEWGPRQLNKSRFLCLSYSSSNVARDAVFSRTLITSRWYQERWGNDVRFPPDQNEKMRYHNTAGGFRFSSTVGGSTTGEGGNRIIVDDPHNTDESDAERSEVIRWWQQVMQSRVNNPKDARWVIIMQRVHHNDLISWIKATDGESWEWLVLPAEFEPGTRCRTKFFFDPRTEPGEVLWKDRWGKKELDRFKRVMGQRVYDAQYQQRPSALEGNLFKRHWWKFYAETPSEKSKQCDYIFQSWDCAFKKLEDSDFVVGQVWGVKGADRFLLDQTRDRLSFTETCTAIESLTAKWPAAKRKLVEDKANGTAVIDALKKKVSGLIPVNPTDSKLARASAVSPEIESGNVHLPPIATHAWSDGFIEECAAFPNGAHDDQVDAMSQALTYAANHQAEIQIVLGGVSKQSIWSNMSS